MLIVFWKLRNSERRHFGILICDDHSVRVAILHLFLHKVLDQDQEGQECLDGSEIAVHLSHYEHRIFHYYLDAHDISSFL